MIEPGEVVKIMVRVQNQGQGTAENTAARVELGTNVFFAEGSEVEFTLGSFKPGQSRDFESQLYTNRRAIEFPVYVSISERHDRYGLSSTPLDLPFNKALRTIQEVVIRGLDQEDTEIAKAGGLSIDIERNIPQGRDQRKDAVALIIANRRYQHQDVPSVEFAHRDAEFVKQYLATTLGYRVGNIFMAKDATYTNFRTALQKLKNAAKRTSDVFIYYTGHGAPDPEEKRGYFVPLDCDPNYVKMGGIALDEFYREINEMEAQNITVVIDACFSGLSDQGMIIKNISPIMLVVENQAILNEKLLEFTSSSGDEVSSWYPEMKHSLYTYYFLKGLQGAADQDKDNMLTVAELQAYLEDQVPYMARRLHNREQTPNVTPGHEDRVLVRYK